MPAAESMLKQVPDSGWFADMGNAFQTYGIYFLVIFVFIVVVYFTSHMYSKACTATLSGDKSKMPELLEQQRTWKLINYGAWFLGGLLAIVASLYWMHERAPSSYSYMINFEVEEPAICVDSTLYYKKVSYRPSSGFEMPGQLNDAIATTSFLIVKNQPFQEGQKFVFNVYKVTCSQPSPCNVTPLPSQEITFTKSDCKGALCMANYQVWNNRFEKVASQTGRNPNIHLLAATTLTNNSEGR
jgi:hypothetical protein